MLIWIWSTHTGASAPTLRPFPQKGNHDAVLAGGSVEALLIGERIGADDREIHVSLDELDQDIIPAEPEESAVEFLVDSVDALDVTLADYALIVALDKAKASLILLARRQPNSKRRLALQQLADLVDLPDLVGGEAAYEAPRLRSRVTMPARTRSASPWRTWCRDAAKRAASSSSACTRSPKTIARLMARAICTSVWIDLPRTAFRSVDRG